MNVLEINYFPSKTTSYILRPGLYDIGDINKLINYFLPGFVNVSITIVDISLRCKLNTNQTLIFTIKSFFYTIIGFT